MEEEKEEERSFGLSHIQSLHVRGTNQVTFKEEEFNCGSEVLSSFLQML